MKTAPIVIIGGGFGGLQAALALDRLNQGEVQSPIFLVDPAACHVYTPSFYEMVSNEYPHLTEFSFDHLLADTAIHHVQEKAIAIDFDRRIVRTEHRTLPYQDLIIALGTHVRQPPEDPDCLDVMACKTYEDVATIRRHVLACFAGEHGGDSCAGHHFVIKGGGPAGVEFSAGLTRLIYSQAARLKISPRKFKVSLVETAPRILPMLPERVSQLVGDYLSRLGVRIITGAEAKMPITKQGEKVHTVWTIGTQPHTLIKKLKGVHLSNNGRILVDASLQVIDQPRVWAVGDAAAIMDSGVAWPAVLQGRHVAYSIMAVRREKVAPAYFPLERTVLLPLSSTYGVACFGSRVVDGLWVVWYKRWRDLHYFLSLQPLWGALILWLSRTRETGHNIAHCPQPHPRKGSIT